MNLMNFAAREWDSLKKKIVNSYTHIQVIFSLNLTIITFKTMKILIPYVEPINK